MIRMFVRGAAAAALVAGVAASQAFDGEHADTVTSRRDAAELDGPFADRAWRLAGTTRVVAGPFAGLARPPRGAWESRSAAPVAQAQAAASVPVAEPGAESQVRAAGGNGYRHRRAAAGYVPVPLQASIDAVQPMTGIVLWNDNASALTALGGDVQLEFAYLRYSDVVGEAGAYDWGAVEQRLASASARGHQMILRFHDTYPGHTGITIPAHVADSPDHALAWYSVEGRRTFIPDWRSTTLQDFVLEFYTRFAQRYDRDPRLAFLQVGFGSYGEYHLWDGPLELGRTFPSKAFQQRFLEHLERTFAHTPWSLSIDAANPTYTPFSSVQALRQLRFGLFDDSFMHETHSASDQEYNRASWLFFGDARVQHSPAGGEFSYYSEYDQRHVLDPEGAWGRSFESFAAQYRISYMIGNDQPRYQPAERIREAAMATGYAFRIVELASNGECVRIGVRNEGIAPIYHDAWPATNGRRAAASLKGLMPGASLATETCIGQHQPGALRITIESDRLVPGQRIGYRADLR